MNKHLTVLLIEDDKVDQLAFKRFVERSRLNYDYEVASSFREAKILLESRKFDIVITDYFLGDGTAFDVFKYISDSSIIITTGTGDEEVAVRAMKSGAYDYLIKDPDRNYLTVLPVTVENALKKKEADENSRRLKLLESAILYAFDAVAIAEAQTSELKDLKIKVTNDAFTKMTGYDYDQVAGKSIQILFGPDTEKQHIEEVEAALAKKVPLSQEMMYYKEDGSHIWVELSMRPTQSDDKNAEHWVFIQRDITERRQTSAQLLFNKKRLDVILQSMGDGVIVTDNDQKLLIFNNKAKALLSLCQPRQDQLTLSTVLKNCHENGSPLLNKIKEGPFNNFELQVISPEQRTLLVTSTPLQDPGGTVAGNVIILKDFTKEKEIDKMKTDFVSNVSHELRTPLASILGFSSTIIKDKNMPDEVKDEFSEIIYKESTRLAQLIEDILSISRIESGRSAYELKKMDILPVLDEVLESFQIQAKDKNINLIKDVDSDIPSINADSKAVRQVLINLIGNAIKFTPNSGAVTTQISLNGKSVIVAISDTGIGMPKKDLNRIFDKFYRIYRENTPVPGTGLGLSIVKEIINFHNGTIEVESEEDKGTTFKVTFKLYED